MVWIKLIICVLIILFLGKRVARYGDTIAEKTGMGGLWIGLVLISITTSLPELFNGISAIFIVKQPDLTVGNLLGANTFNLLNLAFLDILYRHTSIFNVARSGQRTTALFSLILIAATGISLFFQPLLPFNIGWLGWGTIIVIALYLFFVRKTFLSEKDNPVGEAAEIKYKDISFRRTIIYFAISAAGIIGAGLWLAMIGDEISAITGLGESFIGSLFLGLATTLPEITVSYSALRLGAVDMAISNMIGSNMFNMFIICLDDILFVKGPIFESVSKNNLTTVITAILLSLITLAALYLRPRRFYRVSWYNILVILVFVGGAAASFMLNSI